MGLIDWLGEGPVALDTPVFIYLVEEHEKYRSVVRPIFEAMSEGGIEAVTSALTLHEVLVHPYRIGNPKLASLYEGILANSRGLKLIDVDQPILRAAAFVRAETRLRAPDAIQVASALTARCTALVTNDRDYAPLPGLRVFQVDAFA
jgi:predicted nucleic acid-binding protein